MNLGLGPIFQIPYKQSLAILVFAITLIGMHHQIEIWLNIEKNTMLIVAPLIISGMLMIWRNHRARHYIESDVEWWTLLFFMMLFAIVSCLQSTGVTTFIAQKFAHLFNGNSYLLVPLVIGITALGSAFVDNIVFVATFIPIIQELNSTALWWALLFGACYGGNITLIGSTANIVALGMLEKRYSVKIKFFEWVKIGALVGILTCALAWGGILLLSHYMPR